MASTGADTQMSGFVKDRRAQLIADRTRFRDRIHNCLAQALVPAPGFDLFSAAGRDWLASVSLPAHLRAAVDSSLRQLDLVEEELLRLAPELREPA